MLQKTLKNRTIFCHDNLDILRGINSDSIDLIYLDPPFNKNKNFTAPIGTEAEGASFNDIFRKEDIKEEWLGLIADQKPNLAEYIQGITNVGYKYNKYYLIYMAVRLIEIHRILKDTGSLYLHCDPTMSHYLKILLDIIFSEDNFRNEIVWSYKTGGVSKKNFSKKHDIIFFYSKTANYVFYSQLEKSYTKSKSRKAGIINYGKGDAEFFEDEKGVYNFVEMRSVWNISYIGSTNKERLGYPTQKPKELLERVIKASSKEGDVILDPFCGCATTCIAAEKLGCQWVGIDVSPKAFELVKKRLSREVEIKGSLPNFLKKVHYRVDIPNRTDIKIDKRKKKDIKHELFGKQEGLCSGCKIMFNYANFEVDHIVPQSKGGGDNIENLQLLCSSCNKIKGDKPMEYLKNKLAKL